MQLLQRIFLSDTDSKLGQKTLELILELKNKVENLALDFNVQMRADDQEI